MDQIVESVRKKLADRSAAGVRKYGTTMERTDLSRLDWLRHAQEELLDGAVYLERLIRDETAAAADTGATKRHEGACWRNSHSDCGC